MLTAAAAGMSPEDVDDGVASATVSRRLSCSSCSSGSGAHTVADGAMVLTLARLEALGGARRIVERHLLDALAQLSPSEQNTASDCFRFLVSSSGTKIAHPAVDLAEWTGRSEAEVDDRAREALQRRERRILRAVANGSERRRTSYELFHDVLAEPILAWRREHERELSRRAARRRLLRVGSVALALIALFAGLSVWALVERSHANDLVQQKQAANRALMARIARLRKQREQRNERARRRRPRR